MYIHPTNSIINHNLNRLQTLWNVEWLGSEINTVCCSWDSRRCHLQWIAQIRLSYRHPCPWQLWQFMEDAVKRNPSTTTPRNNFTPCTMSICAVETNSCAYLLVPVQWCVNTRLNRKDISFCNFVACQTIMDVAIDKHVYMHTCTHLNQFLITGSRNSLAQLQQRHCLAESW